MKSKIRILFLCYFCYIFGCLTVYIFSSNIIEKDIDSILYIDGKQQVFRDENGYKLELIKYKNRIYVPITEQSLYLNYSIEEKENNFYLESFKKDNNLNIDTTMYNGSRFTNEDIFEYKYTIFFNWAYWCSDCKRVLEVLPEYLINFQKEFIQFVGVPIYDDEKFTKEEIENKIQKVLEENNVDFLNIHKNKYLEEHLQNNILNIPSFVVVDNVGRIVKIEEREDLDLNNLIQEIKDLIECNNC